MMAQSQRVDMLISTSSLSPLAVPFTLRRASNQFSSHSALGLAEDSYESTLKTLSGLYVEDDEVDYFDCHCDIPAVTQGDTCFSDYPSDEYENFSDYVVVGNMSSSDFVATNEVSLPMYTQGFASLDYAEYYGNDLLHGKKEEKVTECKESLRKESSAGGTVAKSSLKGLYVENVLGRKECFDSGNQVADGLNSCLTSDCIHGESARISVGGNTLMSQSEKQRVSLSSPSVISSCEVSPFNSSVDSSTGKFKAVQESQLSYLPCEDRGRNFVLNDSLGDGLFLQVDSCTSNIVLYPPERPSSSVISRETSTSCPLLNSYSKKTDIADKCTIKNENNSCQNASATEVFHTETSTKREENDEKSKTDEGKEKNLLESIPDRNGDKPLANSDIHNDGFHSNKASFSIDRASSISDSNDSDVDSPCWKGMKTSGSLFEISEPGQSQQNKKAKAVRLNPLAPQFLPSSVVVKKNSSTEVMQGDFSSFPANVPYHPKFSLGECEPLKVTDMEPYSFELRQIRIEYPKDDCACGKAFPMVSGKRDTENSVMGRKVDVQAEPARTCKTLSSSVKFSAANSRTSKNTAPYDGHWLKGGSHTSNCVADSPEKYSAALFVPYGSSGNCKAYLHPNSSSVNGDGTRTCMVKNKRNYPCHDSLEKDFRIQNSNGKGSNERKSLKVELKDVCEYKHDSSEDKLTAKNSIPDDCIPETCSNKAMNCAVTSSKILGDSDSDSFYSCRKGTEPSPWPCGVSRPGQPELQKMQKFNILNPLAPQFVPAAAGAESYLGNEHFQDDLSTLQINNMPSPMNISFGDCGLSKSEIRRYSYGSKGIRYEYHRDSHDKEKGIGIQSTGDNHDKEKPSSMSNDEEKSAVLNSSCRSQPTTLNDCSTFNKKTANLRCTTDSSQGMEETLQVVPTMASYIAKNHALSSSLSGAGSIAELIENLLVVSKPMSSSPNVDIQNVIRAMVVLSELLVQSRSNGSDLDNENQNDLIQHIIKNLSVFRQNHFGQQDVMPESFHTRAHYSLDKSTDPQCSNMKFGAVGTGTVPDELHPQNDLEGDEIHYCRVSIENRQDSSSSCSILGAEKYKEMVPFQVIRKRIARGLKVAEDDKMQASVFKNLWLDTEAELCMRKYETYLWRMKGGRAGAN